MRNLIVEGKKEYKNELELPCGCTNKDVLPCLLIGITWDMRCQRAIWEVTSTVYKFKEVANITFLWSLFCVKNQDFDLGCEI